MKREMERSTAGRGQAQKSGGTPKPQPPREEEESILDEDEGDLDDEEADEDDDEA